jgi:RimJ/RimL family protein N-acetyltransferase
MKHIIAYEGLVNVSLGLMQEDYVSQFLPWPNRRIGIEGTRLRPPYSLASGIEWVHGLDKQKGSNEVFAILLHTGTTKKRTYQYVGHTGLHDINWPNGIAKTGSVIGNSKARGQGCGTEAKLLLEYHAFMVVGVRKITSEAKVFNGASIGHLIKCGYKLVGRRHAHHFHEGAYVDEILFEVFREDWEPIWEQYQTTKTLPRLTDAQRALVKEITGT